MKRPRKCGCVSLRCVSARVLRRSAIGSSCGRKVLCFRSTPARRSAPIMRITRPQCGVADPDPTRCWPTTRHSKTSPMPHACWWRSSNLTPIDSSNQFWRMSACSERSLRKGRDAAHTGLLRTDHVRRSSAISESSTSSAGSSTILLTALALTRMAGYTLRFAGI